MEGSLWHLLTFFVYVLLEKFVLEALKHLPFFDLKSCDVTSPKRHFLNKVATEFAAAFCEDVKLEMDNVKNGLNGCYIIKRMSTG